MIAEPNEKELLEVAQGAARGAGELLLERFRSGEVGNVEAKSTPTDLVSEADLASQRLIRELIRKSRPADGFLGEEKDADGPAENASGLTWVVDPLDGTVNFLFGIPQWCVSVAVTDRRGIVAGAIYDPCRGELFSATRGGPAMLNGQELMGPPARELQHAMVATGFYYEAKVRAVQAGVLERLLPAVRDIRRFGSAALDLAWTAAGRYDAYFERGIKQWDRAAGELLCRCSGLGVRELAPVRGPEGEELAPAGVLVARGGLLDQLESLIVGVVPSQSKSPSATG